MQEKVGERAEPQACPSASLASLQWVDALLGRRRRLRPQGEKSQAPDLRWEGRERPLGQADATPKARAANLSNRRA